MFAPQINSLPFGRVGLVAALTLLQNGISVRIINKDLHPRIGQRGSGMWISIVALLVRSYKPGTLEPLQDLSIVPHVEPTPAIPFQVPKLMSQQLLDVILRRHLEKFSCSVEMDTELCSFEQSDEGVTAILAKNGIPESFDTKWIIDADGAKSETRDDTWVVTEDICLTGVGLDRVHGHQFGNFLEQGVSLRPTDAIGDDGWQFFLFSREFDLTKIAQSEELVFETIALLIPIEITFNKVVWMSDFRVHSPTGGQGHDSGVQYAKEIANNFLLETYSAERLPVILEMLEVTTSILDRTIITIVLDEFVASVKPVNVYGVHDEGNLEAGDRPDATTLFGLHRPWYHTTLVFAPSLADATPTLGALEAYDKSVVRSAVVLLSSASVTPVASPVGLVLVDREGYAYSAYIVEVGQTKEFVIRPDRVIGAIVHGVEDIFRYVASTFINHFWPLTLQVQPIPVYLIQCRN
ncbi:hypothetical protein BDR06DRAFT_984955 [Suillus hirtellus]|nr:hypothetical protein BDR06DRAFT_984955 [Suillus hirtellus]